MLRSTDLGLLVLAGALLTGCGESKSSQCDKLALTVRGVAKKEMAASASGAEKAGGTETEIERALKRSSVALERELDDWQLKRPDKNTSDKGAITVKAYADGVKAVEVKDETLKGMVAGYAAAVQGVFDFSKERVEANSKEKGHEAISAVETEAAKITAWCNSK